MMESISDISDVDALFDVEDADLLLNNGCASIVIDGCEYIESCDGRLMAGNGGFSAATATISAGIRIVVDVSGVDDVEESSE